MAIIRIPNGNENALLALFSLPFTRHKVQHKMLGGRKKARLEKKGKYDLMKVRDSDEKCVENDTL